MKEEDRIYILATKVSKKSDTTFCIGVHKLGTPFIEFILGGKFLWKRCHKRHSTKDKQ